MAANSTKKSKTPGPDGKKKSSIMEKRAQSEGAHATRSKTPTVKNPANANKSATKKTPKKTPKKLAVEDKKKLTYENEEAISTPDITKGKKPKTPKSSKKVEASTPKGKTATPGVKQKTPKSAKKTEAVDPLPYGLDDEDYDEEGDDTFADLEGSDSDDYDSDDGSDFSDDEDDMDDEDDDEDAGDDDAEVVFNTPGNAKTIGEPVSSSLSPSKTKKTPKSAMKAPQTDDKPKKTPKSSLKTKTPGTAKSDKKVTLSVTVPDEEEQKQHKKAVTTPHPSLTKLKSRAPSAADDDKENKSGKKNKGSLQEEPLIKQLSFGDDNSEEDMDTGVKGQGVKRKHKATKSDGKHDGPPGKKGKKDDDHMYHCGNLPARVDKNIVRLFFAEAGVDVISILVKNEKLTKMERTEGKDKKKGKKVKKKTIIDHCFAILKVATKEEGKKLEDLNGIEFTAPQGRWRSHQLTIYPMLQRPVKEVKDDEPCAFVKLGYKIDDQQLRDFLTQHKVEPRKVFIVRRGIRQVSKGYGFAWFKSPEDVEKAIKLSGKELQGFKVDISQAQPKKTNKQHQYKIGSERS